MIFRAQRPRLIIAALATMLVTACYQAIATRDDAETHLPAVKSVQLDTQPQLIASAGGLATTVNLLATNSEDVQTLCSFPARLHPASQLFLDSYVAGRMATHEFLRVFSLPNSDYIPLARCFVTIVVDGIPMP
ncbi:MAG: hypothetical protein OES46_03845 [Gammaproteobacteria bacterium]|jgi:hypothetical protein|nr:hypothetical protein [Gammaproteobacteria bacterium]